MTIAEESSGHEKENTENQTTITHRHNQNLRMMPPFIYLTSVARIEQ
jgi:hypothetical protein